MSNLGWIPVTEKLPENLEEVIITWVNKDLDLYFSDIKGKKFSGAAVYCNNHWYWYSSTTQDVLFECGEYKDMLIDDAIEITAWMPLPEPYKEESEDDHTD